MRIAIGICIFAAVHCHNIAFGRVPKTCAPRVISDLSLINGPHGVPIDFRYNETDINFNGLTSAPGCPQSIDGIPWIYCGRPLRCYLTGTRGPCPPYQKLLRRRGSPFGVCACECLTEHDFSKELQGPDRYVRCFREQNLFPSPNEQIFGKVKKTCFSIYEWRPCQQRGLVGTDIISNFIESLPFCNQYMPGWEKMEEAGKQETVQETARQFFSGTRLIGANECPKQDEVYSRTLKKCIKRYSGKNLVVG